MERKSSLADVAHRRLTDLILTRQLLSGEAIVEDRLAETLHISRTPLREALVRLAGEGLLVKQASRSFSVRKVSASEFFQSMKVRAILETEAITLAIDRVDLMALEQLRRDVERLSTEACQAIEHWEVDDRLHMLFADASGNAVLADTIRNLRIKTRLFEVIKPFDRITADAQEHAAIIDAYSSGEAKAARRALQRHLRNLQGDVMAILSGYSNFRPAALRHDAGGGQPRLGEGLSKAAPPR
jgi:DNA-binding GntR family transcriptional regulator